MVRGKGAHTLVDEVIHGAERTTAITSRKVSLTTAETVAPPCRRTPASRGSIGTARSGQYRPEPLQQDEWGAAAAATAQTLHKPPDQN
jgi:hypothetical protein